MLSTLAGIGLALFGVIAMGALVVVAADRSHRRYERARRRSRGAA